MKLFKKSKLKSKYGYRFTKLIYTPFLHFYDPLIEFSIGCNKYFIEKEGNAYCFDDEKNEYKRTELRWLEFRIYGFGVDINWSEDRGFWLNSFNQNHSAFTYYFRNLLKRTK